MTTNTLAYSTTTPLRIADRRVVVELECNETGYRYWTRPMWESNISAMMERLTWYSVSDVDYV